MGLDILKIYPKLKTCGLKIFQALRAWENFICSSHNSCCCRKLISLTPLSLLFFSSRGQVLVTVAAGMTLLLGMAAITVDAGTLYLQRQRLANAVDAAALAGAQELPARPALAYQQAMAYAEQNGCSPEEVVVQIAPSNKKITVTAQRQIPLFFARTLGHQTASVSAQATAAVSPVKALMGAAPLSIEEQILVFGEEYTLKSAPSEGGGEPLYGWYGPLSLGGSGARSYCQNLKYGYESELRVGDVVATETGNMSGPTVEGIAYRVDACHHDPPCTFEHFAPGCPRVLLVPVIVAQETSGNQIKTVRIQGFAAFFIENYARQGNECEIRGRFVHTAVSAPYDESLPGYGVYAVHLEAG